MIHMITFSMQNMQMSEDQDLIPTKDAPMYQMGLAGVELDLTVDSDAALLQQRMLVAKLSREEVEDRYLRLLEENTLLKKHACKQIANLVTTSLCIVIFLYQDFVWLLNYSCELSKAP